MCIALLRAQSHQIIIAPVYFAFSIIPQQLQRHKATFPIIDGDAKEIKQRMLDWSRQFSIFLFLDNNAYRTSSARYECLLAAGAEKVVNGDQADMLASLQNLHDVRQDWLFGHICYDYKNVLEPKLVSSRHPTTGFPLLHFFIPRTVCHINPEQTLFTIESFDDPATIYDAILGMEVSTSIKPIPSLSFKSVIDKDSYIDTISKLREHIGDGDCYEINFCNKGYVENAAIDPLQVFHALNALSPAPFAAYYRLTDKYMMCASPERYLCKNGNKLLSQPIKGTARRDKDRVKDAQIKEALRSDIKERAENVMIVDLVRNDLSRCSETGSVQVDELFGIYSFPQVHQMVSSVSSTLRKGAPFTDAIRYSFPMGSMTGAPKYKVMQLIELYEQSRRELFSGTVGYITPDGDFDLNVIIRSLFYNEETKYLSYQTGGAITYDSDPQKEWEEMRLKAWALERVFE
jgi:para-aminobenzoate synthetase component 1